MDKAFYDGFAKAAAEVGVAAEEIPALFEQAFLLELLEKDAAFRAGFEAEMEKAGQYGPPQPQRAGFWKGLGNLAMDSVSSMLPFGGMIRGHSYRKKLQAAQDPTNVANMYNQQKQNWMQQRQKTDQIYGMNGPGGGFGRPGYGMPGRWSGGYGSPGWY